MPQPEVIDLLDASTASEAESRPSSHVSKLPNPPITLDDLEEKVQWTDDSDGKLASRKRRGGRSGTLRRAKRAKPASRGRPRKSQTAITHAGSESDAESRALVLPSYLESRRKEFEENVNVLNEAGLRLPPDFSDLQFSEDIRLGELEERPRFSEASGIKPHRPYEDVILEHSGGLIPASIAQYLRDYQIAGVKFLHRLFVYQRGGILGDDMGLGKTVQVAAFLSAAYGKTGDERDAKRMRKMRREAQRWYPRTLIVCPGSIIKNWKNELEHWGWWHVDLFHGPSKADVLAAARAGLIEIMITTYETYKQNMSMVNTVEWDVVVADECHRLKDPGSEITRAMDEINSLCRLGLTGTAIQNKYEELWTLLNWTNPGHFGSLSQWKQTISKPLTIGQSHDATLNQLSIARRTAKKLVQNLLPGIFLRRMKTLIADQLPKKSDKVVFCPLTDLQSEAYQNFLDTPACEILRSLSDDCPCGSGKKKGWCCFQTLPNRRHWMSVVFPYMTALQKISNHVTLLIPGVGDLPDKRESQLSILRTALPDKWEALYNNRDSMLSLANPEYCGKWKILKKLLRFWHENGDKVLVFSHSVRLLRILQHLFYNTSYSVSYLDGSLSYEERQNVVDDFNSDHNRFVFLISTKAGGVGLNITSANKVVIMDPHWNPSYDLQAQDRAYRIGQTRDVDVFRLISAGTIEEIVYARQIYKQQQANIGYTASSERRYFKGVQEDQERRGEIFGLSNLFTYHANQIVLRDIVNKTNIAEAKAGIHLADVDMDQAIKDEAIAGLKKEEKDDDDSGIGQLAALVKAENQWSLLETTNSERPKSDAIQAILLSAGVEYMHENSEVVGSSKIEQQLSRRAELATALEGAAVDGDISLFPDSQEGSGIDSSTEHVAHIYNPPEAVMVRQFCTMAREFGFPSATHFALQVENWTPEQRRNCLDKFYKKREEALSIMAARKNEGSSSESETEDEFDNTALGAARELIKPERGETNDRIRLEEIGELGTELLSKSQKDEEGLKLEDINDTKLVSSLEYEVKGETKSDRETPPITQDTSPMMKEESAKPSVSIFLSDDDDDDEL